MHLLMGQNRLEFDWVSLYLKNHRCRAGNFLGVMKEEENDRVKGSMAAQPD
jgi:hypothetical protein